MTRSPGLRGRVGVLAANTEAATARPHLAGEDTDALVHGSGVCVVH
jgi:hypothetical protein